jgi:hypothetical protein
MHNLLILELREANNYHIRMLFFDIVETIISRFSKKYFRDNMFHEYLEMAHDPVPNIRLRFVSILPLIHKTLRMPQDTPLLQKIADVTEPLLTRDLDSDVVERTSEVFAELGLFGFRAGVEPVSSSRNFQTFDLNSNDSTDKYLTRHIPPPDESYDKKKEEEEHAILVKEWSSEDQRRKRNYFILTVLVERGRNSLKIISKESIKRVETSRKKSVPSDFGSSKRASPTTSTTKIAVKSGKGTLYSIQAEPSTEKSAPSSPVMSKTWKASANYKIGASPNSLSSPRNSTGGMPDDNKPLGRLSGSLKASIKPLSSPPPGEHGKLRSGLSVSKRTK